MRTGINSKEKTESFEFMRDMKAIPMKASLQ